MSWWIQQYFADCDTTAAPDELDVLIWGQNARLEFGFIF